MVTIPIDSLPPEVLQSVWRHLSFFELLHCQQVCKQWNAYLPGDDPALHRALFSPTANKRSRTTAGWRIFMNVRQHLETSDSELPCLKFSLDMEPADRYVNVNEEEEKEVNEEDWHPLLVSPDEFSYLFHPDFSKKDWLYTFDFYAFKDLKKLAEQHEKEDQAWEQMLACVPAVQTMEVDLFWRYNVVEEHSFNCVEQSCTVHNTTGIIVWDLVKVVRQALEGAEALLRANCGRMNTIDGCYGSY